MMHRKGPHICYVEFPADNIARSKKFYSSLFGWQVEREDATSSSEYDIITLKEEDGTHHIVGGVLKRLYPEHTIMVYINVPSIKAYEEKVKKLGGRVEVAKQVVAGKGYLAICIDTENNKFALWEEDKTAK